jgi:hypothetical protein
MTLADSICAVRLHSAEIAREEAHARKLAQANGQT